MARVYISSTFDDLEEIREGVAKALRLHSHEVVAMEDYVAQDARPLDACLRDVAASDVYVGIFAFRYGHIPNHPDNPNHLSITELELEQAGRSRIPRLVFVLKDDASWPANRFDSQDPAGDGGARIAALRTRLLKDHLVKQFSTESELENLVTASVAKSGNCAERPAPPAEKPAQVRPVREHVLLLHCAADAALAHAWADALSLRKLGVALDDRLLFAQNERDVLALDVALVSHDVVVLLVTPASAGLMASDLPTVTRTLSMAAARSGCFVASVHDGAALPTGVTPTFTVASRGLQADGHVAADDVGALVNELDRLCPTLSLPGVVGLSYTIVAMKADEAAAVANDPTLVTRNLSSESARQFDALWQSLQQASAGWPTRHGATRAEWRPLGGPLTAGELLAQSVDRLNSGTAGPLRNRKIRLQYYPIDPLLDPQDRLLRRVYEELERTGCVAIVARAFLGERQVSVITVAPTVPARGQIEEMLDVEARKALASPYRRYDKDYDPHYEFGVEEELQLRRYLHRSLPDTVQRITEPGIDPDKRRDLHAELGESSNFGGLLFR
jgi:hypothetical protein